MTEVKDKDFWQKEHKMLWKLFDKLPGEVDQGKFPRSSLRDFEDECHTLSKYLRGKAFSDLYSPEETKQLESNANVLGYSPDKGIHAWFDKRKKEKKDKFFKTRSPSLSDRKNTEKDEIACVKKFYENKGRHYSQIKKDKENSPTDIIVEEHYQVTHFQTEAVGTLYKGDEYFGEAKTPEELKKNIKEVIDRKEPKSSPGIILLIDSYYPSSDEESLKAAIAGLSVSSSFEEIYIVTPKCNLPIKSKNIGLG